MNQVKIKWSLQRLFQGSMQFGIGNILDHEWRELATSLFSDDGGRTYTWTVILLGPINTQIRGNILWALLNN